MKTVAFRLKRGNFAHTLCMDGLRKVFKFIKEKYSVLAFKRYTTLAGTLVFFLIMSIVPFSFWLTLFLGRLSVSMEEILRLPVFNAVQDVLLFVQQEAKNATASVSIILLVTSAYSSTNLFYQMRRSGEIIYDYRRLKAGFRVRIGALALTGIIILMFIVFLVLFALGTFVFSTFFSTFWERLADYLLLLVLAFLLVWLLNMYVCPYKTAMRHFLPGTIVTISAWIVAITGFSVYLKITNMDKLYGALTTIIVFLLWLYVLMICFIVGVIFNSEKINARRKRSSKTKKSE